LETTRGLKKIRGFDRILLDAPCSGLGTLRRNPDIKWMVSKQNLKRYAEKQIKLLENMVPLVNCCGVVVYAVCSTEPEENEDVVNAFLKNHPEFAIDKCIEDHLKKYNAFADPDGYFRTYPQQSHLDGFFFVRLKRIK
jgi:16S rRNA (cytosine967-C5)-methyltransferase